MFIRYIPYIVGLGFRDSAVPVIRSVLTAFFAIYFASRVKDFKQFRSIEDNAEVDFIIVGGGSAGCALAARLSEIPSFDVLILEDGPLQTPLSYVPGLWPFLFNSDLFENPRTVEQANAVRQNDGIGQYPYGNLLGGGSSVNGMVHMRGNKFDYDEWANDFNNPGWDYDTLLPYFKKLEDYNGPTDGDTDDYRGSGGPIGTTKPEKLTDFQNVIKEAGEELGLGLIDPNAKTFIGLTTQEESIKNGVRQSTAETYIRPNAGRENLNVVTNAKVVKVLFDSDDKATGVRYILDGVEKTVHAKKEVILSAGAINSPKILMLSGIGPTQHLQDNQITVLHDLPGVGQNFHDHIGIFGALTFLKGNIKETNNRFIDYALPSSILQYVFFRKGPLIHLPALRMSGFVSLEGNDEKPDMQLEILEFSLTSDKAFMGYNISQYNGEFFLKYFGDVLYKRAFNINTYILKPKSRGSITLKSNDPFDEPNVDPNYLDHEDDRVLLGKAIKYSKEMGQTQAMIDRKVTFYDKPLPGCTDLELESDEYWQCYGKVMARSYYHPAGSCKMAPSDDPMGVVDNRLRVREVTNLRVVDCSIMPSVASGNTNIPTIMVAERAADLIKEDWS